MIEQGEQITSAVVGTSDDSLATRLQLVLSARDREPQWVAHQMDVTASAVNKWLRTGNIRRENLIALADLLHVDLAWLLTGRDAGRSDNSEPAYAGGSPYIANRGAVEEDLARGRLARVNVFTVDALANELTEKQAVGLVYTAVRTSQLDLVGLVVPDAALSPEFAPGDIVICDRRQAPYAEAVVVGVPDQASAGVIRRCRITRAFAGRSDSMELVSDNTFYPSYQSVSNSGWKTVGVVIEHRRRLGPPKVQPPPM